MPPFLLACLAYLSIALPASTLGLLWPSMRLSFGEPIGALGIPLLVTALLSGGLSWHRAYGLMALVQAALAIVFIVGRRGWRESPRANASRACEDKPGPADGRARRRPPAAVALTSLTFAAVETGIESGAGIWGYVFLTAGQGLPAGTAGVAVSAYWAMMFAGRVVLGPVAERLGPARVLAAAVAGIPAGAALMTAPGPGLLAVIGLMILGLAAAPVFPLLTLMTPQWRRRYHRGHEDGEPSGRGLGHRQRRTAGRPGAGHRSCQRAHPRSVAARPRRCRGRPLRVRLALVQAHDTAGHAASLTTVIPAVALTSDIAASARPVSSSAITSPTSRPGRSAAARTPPPP